MTSDYEFLLWLVNTSTVDTEEYYPRCYKVNDAKIFENLVVSFYALCWQIICILQIGSFNWGLYVDSS